VSNDSVPLQFAHIQRLAAGGESSPDNLTVLCPNCHIQFDRQPHEIEFTAFLGALLKDNPLFREVELEPLIEGRERFRPDILVKRLALDDEQLLVIECKTAVVLGTSHITSAADQLKRYAAHVPGARPVLAVPATLSVRELAILASADIEVWDLPTLADAFRDQLPRPDASFYGNLLAEYLLRDKRKTREEELVSRLEICKPGKSDWLLYQTLVGEILEELFCPPLYKPIPQHSDSSKVNRPDFLIPNYADSGFWAFLRDKYQADYVVVDAKNHSGEVGKLDVLQIANYLKPYGAGLFAIICSRLGGDKCGCEHTLREQWLDHNKLIGILDDYDLSMMLAAKSERRGPEGILTSKIQNFRLSM